MPWCMPLGTNLFTQQPYETRVLENALKQSSIICFNSRSLTSFVTHKLISELSFYNSEDSQQHITLLLVESEKEVKNQVQNITDHIDIEVLGCYEEIHGDYNQHEIAEHLYTQKILILCPSLALDFLSKDVDLIFKVKMLIFQHCDQILVPGHPYNSIMNKVDEHGLSPYIYGVTSTLLQNDVIAEELKKSIESMEMKYHCKALTATDLVAHNIHSMANPEEHIISCSDQLMKKDEFFQELHEILTDAYNYLTDCNITSDVFIEIKDFETVNIPTPDEKELKKEAVEAVDGVVDCLNVTATPIEFIKGLLVVLDVLGIWSVYKLTQMMMKMMQSTLITVERKLKQNEQVFSIGSAHWKRIMLLHLHSVLREIYTICHHRLSKKKKPPVEFVSPKVHRLLELLREYKPPQSPNSPKNKRRVASPQQWVNSDDNTDDDNLTGEEENEDEEDDDDLAEQNAKKFTQASSLCAVAFVHNRHVAVMLQCLLREFCKDDKSLRHVIPTHLVIANNKNKPENNNGDEVELDATAMDKAKQEEVLRKFRHRDTNFLITADSLKECHFATRCNLVVSFDVPSTYRIYVHSKGKCRAAPSIFAIIVDESEKKEILERLKEYKRVEGVLGSPTFSTEQMKREMKESSDGGDGMSELNDSHVPYVTKTHTHATMKNSIKIINKYCSRLPGDGFTHVGPKYEMIENKDEATGEMTFACQLQLPVNSHVRKPIKGVAMPTVVKAQQAVAVETCKLLHQAGELDDSLLPIGKETVKYAAELEPWKPEASSTSGRPGSTKRRQTYTKKCPSCLSSCMPLAEKNSFIYEVKMRTRAPLPQKLNVRMRKLHLPEDTYRCFGIITTKPIPHIPRFPVFTRSGEEVAGVKLVRSFVTFSQQHIQLFKNFHKYIFSEVLRLERTTLSYQPERSSAQIFLVALTKKKEDSVLDIDWNFMTKTDSKRKHIEKMKKDLKYNYRQTNMMKNRPFEFDRGVYEDGVVIAKYRNGDQPNRFYVAVIKDDMTPMSSFPSNDYKSFHEYYRIKYKLDIKHRTQPLIDVDHTSSRLNLLTPRYLNQKGRGLQLSSLERKRAKYENLHNHQILIPELCEVHPVPASLWRKAVCLPSVIYKCTQLLISEELRMEISKKSGISLGQMPFGFEWPDIQYNWVECHDNELNDDDDDVNSSDLSPSKICEIKEEEEEEEEEEEKEEVKEEEEEDKTEEDKGDDGDDETPMTNGHHDESNGLKGCEEVADGLENGHCESDSASDSYNDDSEAYEMNFVLTDDNEERTRLEEKQKVKRRKRREAEKDKSWRDYSMYSIPQQACSEMKENFAALSSDTSLCGPGPETLLQALTLSSASEGVNLERLEMLGDSFLKHAVTVYLYCTYPNAHEGKLSYMRSKKVSNHNLYRIGRSFGLAERMSSLIFDPTVNWLPCGYMVGAGDDDSDDDSDDDIEIDMWEAPDKKQKTTKSKRTNGKTGKKKKKNKRSGGDGESNSDDNSDVEENFIDSDINMIDGMLFNYLGKCYRPSDGLGNAFDVNRLVSGGTSTHFIDDRIIPFNRSNKTVADVDIGEWAPTDVDGKPINYNEPLSIDLHTQHSLADKSIADCVEALLGSYLTTCGHRAAQLLLCFFGVKVLPKLDDVDDEDAKTVDKFGYLLPPSGNLPPDSGLDCDAGDENLKKMLIYLGGFEGRIDYKFNNKSYLVQAFTHASYTYNTSTECYQRLEFLGDAVLDFLITKHLFTDKRQHSPGALTDLRSALVNNTIFASLAVRNGFHKYFKSISPELQRIIEEFVSYQQMKEETQGMDAELIRTYKSGRTSTIDGCSSSTTYMNESFNDSQYNEREFEDEDDEVEDIEVPKCLGDIFESVAGAIYMDSGMDLDAVWKVYSKMMLPLIEKFSTCVPRSPVRELFELEPETAKFSGGEKRCDGKVRVSVEIIGKGTFKGVGRSYRIAKSAAARRALRYLQRFSSSTTTH